MGNSEPDSLAQLQADLSLALRTAAAQSADFVGGGLALVFTPNESDEGALQLRSAAGFATPQAARTATPVLLPRINDAVQLGSVKNFEALAELGTKAMGGLIVLPLAFQNQSLGALAVTFPEKLDNKKLPTLQAIANQTALRLDHYRVSKKAHDLEQLTTQQSKSTDDKSDEILKLSEALFAQDIELLQSNEKLGKIEKLKNDFIEKMSRELRTPLNSIIEAIISVLANDNEALADNSKVALRSALDDGTAFLRTLQNILDLWRIKQGELPVEIQEINFREVVDEAIFSIQDTLGDKPVTVEKEFVEFFPKLRTDLAKINQILFLLLDNAAKFTPSGTIRIKARVQDGQLTCSISDTGIGICQDDQQYIFDEFYQVDELNSTKYRGSGLGLALVKDLLVLLDGEISVQSEIGQGSTFQFSVPVQIIG